MRDIGWYWIKECIEYSWEPCFWNGDSWDRDDTYWYQDGCFHEIDERRIVREVE